ncbi:MAG: sodium:alanine symporter family protein [Bacilli bacterium]|nr:sodium:alanine symporter family protein [Bacilli bacterium]
MLNTVNYLLWVNLSFWVLFLSLYLSFKSKYLQFRIIKILKSLFKKTKNSGITKFQSLMVTLGGKIGVGSISGVAIAIYYGGPGIIFWMIIISLIISILTYYEVYLGAIYKEKDQDNIYKGGPSYYIRKGLNNKLLSVIYSILIIICYNGCFTSIQSNTLVKMINLNYQINPLLVGIVMGIITLIIINRGIKKIALVSNIIVPVMLILYLGFAFLIFCSNLEIINKLVLIIVNDAFTIKSFLSSFIPVIIMSFQRIVFATESGIGTSSIIASATNNDPHQQAYIQLFGVYITSLIICLSTAIIILTTDYQHLQINDINGIELVVYAFKYHFDIYGSIFLIMIVFMFCFSTIITGYYNGESCLKSLNVKKYNYLKIVTIIIIILGVIFKSSLLWTIVDFLMGIILLINCYAIYKLRNAVKE